MSDDTLERLAAVITSRKGGDPERSYVARLFHKGEDAVLKKVGEEATEVVLACKGGVPERIVAEAADLWFHTLIALAQHGITPAQLGQHLRGGLSGLEEFALRKLGEREREDKEGS